MSTTSIDGKSSKPNAHRSDGDGETSPAHKPARDISQQRRKHGGATTRADQSVQQHKQGERL